MGLEFGQGVDAHADEGRGAPPVGQHDGAVVIEAPPLKIEGDAVQHDRALALLGALPHVGLEVTHKPLLVEDLDEELASGLQRAFDGLQAAQVVAIGRQLAEGAVEADDGVEIGAVGNGADVGLHEMDVELLALGGDARRGQGPLVGVDAQHAMAASGQFQGQPPGAAAQVQEALQAVDDPLDLRVGTAGGIVLQVHAPPGMGFFLHCRILY